MFEWDDANVDHVARHGITPEQTEQAFDDPDRVNGARRNERGERRWSIIGMTEEGRLLFVVYTMRGQHIRVVTAYDAVAEDRRQYRRRHR